MKRIVLATVLACAAMGASADVTVYGRLDTGLLWDNTADTDSVTMESGIAGASRLGFKGSEKINDDLTVGFVLESTVKADTGEALKSGFDRDSYLYINTNYGNLRVGRSGALGGGVSGGMFAGKVSPFGVVYKAAASTEIHAVESRYDNMVRYDFPKMGGLKLAVQYARGDDAEVESAATRYAAVGAEYNVGDLTLIAVADKKMLTSEKNKAGNKDPVSYKLGMQYKLAPVTFYAGYQHTDNAEKVGKVALAGADADSYTFGTRVPVAGGNLNMALGYASGDVDNKDVEITQAAVGYTYALSKRTTLYAAAAYLDKEYSVDGAKDDAKSSTTKQVMAGIYHAF